MRPGNVADKLVTELLEHQVNFQTILRNHAAEVMLPISAAKELQKETDNILGKYCLLANAADASGRLLFNVTPKFHWLWHLADRALFCNPRRGNTFIDESFVGDCKEIVRSAADGTSAHLVSERFLEKYVWGLHFIWTYGDEWQAP